MVDKGIGECDLVCDLGPLPAGVKCTGLETVEPLTMVTPV